MFNWGWYTGTPRSESGIRRPHDARISGQGHDAGERHSREHDEQTRPASPTRSRVSGSRSRVPGPTARAAPTIESRQRTRTPGSEDIPGAELLPGKGKAIADGWPPTEERMIRLWSGPQGAFKAAFAGTTPEAPPMTPRPQRAGRRCDDDLEDRRCQWGQQQGGADVPIPGDPHRHRHHHARRREHAREASW